MYPARQAKNDNPYLGILVRGIVEQGVNIEHYTGWHSPRNVDVFHIHWLEAFTWNRFAKRNRFVRQILANRIIRFAKAVRARGGKVVWTSHNLRPHDSKTVDPVYQKFSDQMLPLLTDVISMTEAGKAQLLEAYPQLSNARHKVIPHPHYRDYFDQLGTPDVPSRTNQAVVFGMIRPYKQVPAIVQAFRRLDGDQTLVILGNGPADECARVQDAIGDDARITFRRGRYADEDLIALLRSSTLSIFNFSEILNSGSVLTALSLNCRVVSPAHDVIRDIHNEVGDDWLQMFDGDITSDIIARAFEAGGEASEPMFNESEPSVVAREHVKLYTENGG